MILSVDQLDTIEVIDARMGLLEDAIRDGEFTIASRLCQSLMLDVHKSLVAGNYGDTFRRTMLVTSEKLRETKDCLLRLCELWNVPTVWHEGASCDR